MKQQVEHTPGPWTKIGSSVGVDAGEIATIWCIDGRQMANVRLIAAAPDLLEALREIVAAADGDGWSQLDASLVNARAAIARATAEIGKAQQ